MPKYTQGGSVAPDGAYPFRVVDSAEDVSESGGNQMIVLHLECTAKDGTVYKVTDYLVFTSGGSKKIDAFILAIGGKVIPGQEVELSAEDCLDKTGMLQLKSEMFNGSLSNKVAYYLAPEPGQPAQAPNEKPRANRPF
jgi:hypothetical protein